MLEIMELVIGYALVIMLSVPFGLLLVRVLCPILLERSKAVSVFVVSLLLGIPFLVGFLWVMSQVSYSIITIILIGVSSYSILIIIGVKRPLQEKESNSHHSRFFSLENIVLAGFLFISIGYFGITALYLGWPQVGDPWSVGTMISLIIENGRLPATYEPISSIAMGYPLGFPVLCAAVSTVSGCVPAVSLLIVASLIMGLIPVAIGWLVFWKEGSLFFATMAFLLSFYLHPIIIARYSLFYYFMNGTYTVMLGIIIVFASLIIIAFNQSSLDSQSSPLVFSVLAFVSFACFVVYPSLVFIPSLLMMFWIGREMRNNRLALSRNTVLLVSTVIMILGVVALAAYFSGQFQYIIDILGRSEHLIYFHVADGYFTVGMTGVFMVIAIATAAYRVIRESDRIPDVVFLVLTAATLLSMNDELYRIGLNILLPSRMVIMMTLWSYSYVAIAFSLIAKTRFGRKESKTQFERTLIPESRSQGLKREIEDFDDGRSRQHSFSSSLRIPARIRRRMNRPLGFKLLSLLLILVIMAPSITTLCSFELTEQKAWFVRSAAFADDFAGMQYVLESFEPSDLVLNYQSFSDLFLQSVGVLNVVFGLPSDKNRAFELNSIWEDPYNSSQIRELLHKYNVSVVYVSSVYSVLDTVNGTPGAHGRPLPQSEYPLAFGSYDFLEEVFAQGACVVFRVLKPLLIAGALSNITRIQR